MNYGHGYRAPRRNKYGAKKTDDGFDSKKERARYQELVLLQKAGKIENLERQVAFQLTPPVRGPETIGPRGGRTQGKVILQGSSYIADFAYVDRETGEYVVEDVKGYRGGEAYRTFMLKKKFFYRIYGIMIREV